MTADSFMTTLSSHSDTVLTLMSAFGETVVFIILLRQKLWYKMPVFLLYLPWTIATDLWAAYLQVAPLQNIQFLQQWSARQVYLSYFKYETIIDSVLMFAVIVELAWSVLRPVQKSLPRSSFYVLTILVALAALSIWPFASKIAPPGYVDTIAVFHVQQTAAILRVLFFLVMAGFSQVLSIGWRDRELQIATGLGFFSVVSLMVLLTHAHQGTDGDKIPHLLDQLVSFSYFGTLAYWVLSFSAKEQERKEFSPQMQQLLLQLGGGARSGRIALSDLPHTRNRDKEK